MTDTEKIKALADAYNEYMKSMAILDTQFDAKVESILERVRQRKLLELRQKIKSNG